MDYLLLWLTAGIRKQRVKHWRIGIAAFLGGLYSTLYLWTEFLFLYTFIGKITLSLLMIGIAFGFHHPLTYFRNLRVFYLVCFIVGGGIMALHYALGEDMEVAGGMLLTSSNAALGSPVSWLVVLVGFPCVWLYTKWSFRSLAEQNTINDFFVPIRVQIAEHVTKCVGLIDTGNQLRDPISRTPVIMMEYALLKPSLPESLQKLIGMKEWEQEFQQLPAEWLAKVRLIPFRAARSKGDVMLAIKPDKFEIWQENKWNNIGKVLIGIDDGNLSSDGTYQAIIHPSCLSMIA